MVENRPVIIAHAQGSENRKFISFEVELKSEKGLNEEGVFLFATRRFVTRFTVPQEVNLDMVLKILCDHNVKTTEQASLFFK
jgi:hypothetical protein